MENLKLKQNKINKLNFLIFHTVNVHVFKISTFNIRSWR